MKLKPSLDIMYISLLHEKFGSFDPHQKMMSGVRIVLHGLETAVGML